MIIPFSPSTLYLSADVAVILTLFGCFNSENFGVRTVFENANPFGYAFSSSPLDFLIVSLLRISLYASAYQLRESGKNSIVAWLDKPVEIFSVACVSFSFLKCLAYSEQKDLVGSAGTYFLPAWNIVSASIFFRLWTNEFNSDTEAQGKNDNDEQEEEPVQLSKIDQIRILLGYSLANFHWMLIGTILSMVSAAVSVMLPHYTSLVMNGITSLSAGVDVSQSINILAMLTFAKY